MKMLGYFFSFRDGMDINVDDLWIDAELADTGLLDRTCERTIALGATP